jgi:hypothetical protein
MRMGMVRMSTLKMFGGPEEPGSFSFERFNNLKSLK